MHSVLFYAVFIYVVVVGKSVPLNRMHLRQNLGSELLNEKVTQQAITIAHGSSKTHETVVMPNQTTADSIHQTATKSTDVRMTTNTKTNAAITAETTMHKQTREQSTSRKTTDELTTQSKSFSMQTTAKNHLGIVSTTQSEIDIKRTPYDQVTAQSTTENVRIGTTKQELPPVKETTERVDVETTVIKSTRHETRVRPTYAKTTMVRQETTPQIHSTGSVNKQTEISTNVPTNTYPPSSRQKTTPYQTTYVRTSSTPTRPTTWRTATKPGDTTTWTLQSSGTTIWRPEVQSTETSWRPSPQLTVTTWRSEPPSSVTATLRPELQTTETPPPSTQTKERTSKVTEITTHYKTPYTGISISSRITNHHKNDINTTTSIQTTENIVTSHGAHNRTGQHSTETTTQGELTGSVTTSRTFTKNNKIPSTHTEQYISTSTEIHKTNTLTSINPSRSTSPKVVSSNNSPKESKISKRKLGVIAGACTFVALIIIIVVTLTVFHVKSKKPNWEPIDDSITIPHANISIKMDSIVNEYAVDFNEESNSANAGSLKPVHHI